MEDQKKVFWDSFINISLDVYRGWDALQFALDQDLAEVGDEVLGKRIVEFHDEMIEFFKKYGDSATTDEISDFLYYVLLDDFNLDLDDGSDSSVAALLISLYKTIVKNEDLSSPIINFVKVNAKGFLPGIDPPELGRKRTKREYKTITIDCEKDGEESYNDECESTECSESIHSRSSSSNPAHLTEEMDNAEGEEHMDDKQCKGNDNDDDDGWVVAGSRRRGKKH